jgi:hypothetical protein
MTFSTPWGNYQYKRLAFGGLNSQDLFDAEIAKIISGIPRVLNNLDDIRDKKTSPITCPDTPCQTTKGLKWRNT